MADKKISQLTGATTPLAGTEEIPLVQSSTTKKVTVSNLTAGRVLPASGITFPATQSASADANTLDDYEQGTWTPTLPNGGTISVNGARYVKVGQQVLVSFFVDLTPTNDSSELRIGGLPFATANYTNLYFGGCFGYTGDVNLTGWMPIVSPNASHIFFFSQGSAVSRTNANYLAAPNAGNRQMILSISYFAAD